MKERSLRHQYDFLISLLLAILITALFVFWNPIQGKYKLDIISKQKISDGRIHIYDDLNFDGTSEKIRFIKDFIARPATLVEDKGQILWQWNLTGEFVQGEFYHFADYNNNGRKEIFLFTYQNDSIFLDAIDIKTEERIIKHQYITNYKKSRGRVDFSIHKILSLDLNADNKKELVFTLGCAFSHITRKLCMYDIENGILRLSEKAGCHVGWDITPFDLDEDGRYEFIGNIHSPGNSRFEYPYSDQYSWLMVCDDQMNYKFPPKKIGKYPAYMYIKPFKVNKQNCLATFYLHQGKVDTSHIALYNSVGKLIKLRKIPFDKNLPGAYFTTFVKDNQYKIALYRTNGLVEILNDSLIAEHSYKTIPYYGRIRKWNIDGDGENEHILRGKSNNELIVTRNDYSDPAIFFLEEDVEASYFSNEWIDGKLSAFVCQNGANVYKLQYKKDSLYTFRFLIWVGVFLLSFAFVWFIGRLYQYYLRRQYEDEKRITSLQVKAIEQQMSPHFTLNILNSIGNLYENHDKQKAQYYFGKYSKLLRITLISSGEIAIPLQDELQFTQSYLELEKLRLNNEFEYRFIDNEHLPDIKVPKFLIHTFVENAVKHGIFPIQGIREGRIDLRIKEDTDQLQVSIEDNGVGRQKAKELKIHSTGKGLSILDEILELYQRFENKKISYRIEDKYTDRDDTGTRVVITISNN
jgi:hypothetical protein